MDAARTQKLTALAIGFYQGSRIKVGQTFEFEGDKPPKWAAPAGQVTLRVTGKPVRGDIKPPAAAKAAAKKAANAAGTADADLA